MPGMPGFPPMMPPAFSVPPPGFVPSMSMVTGPAGSSGDWSEHKAPDNRIYYYNNVTKQSSWQKPDCLKTPAEVSSINCFGEVNAASGYCSCYYLSVLGKSTPRILGKYIITM